MTIAITGATGQLGRLVIEKLKTRTAPSNIVALVRSPAKAADLGIAARAADYAKPETLASALAQVDTLLLISSSEVGQRAQQHRNVIEAAKKAGVKHIVYTSLLHADTSVLNLAEEHIATEQMLKASGIVHTILRNGWYTENYTGSVPGALSARFMVAITVLVVAIQTEYSASIYFTALFQSIMSVMAVSYLAMRTMQIRSR